MAAMAVTAQSAARRPLIARRRLGMSARSRPASTGPATGRLAVGEDEPYGEEAPQSRGAAVLIFRVREEVAALAAVAVAEEQEASSGRPLQLRAMALAKPEPAWTFTGTTAVSPATTVIWSTLRVKAPEGVGSLTSSVSGAER